MRTFAHDLTFAIRVALKRPTLSAVTVVTLALGIGGSSAIFSMLNALFLRPLPVSHPEQLVRIFGQQDARPYDVASFANLSDLAARTTSFSAAAIHQRTSSAYGLGDATEPAGIELVSGNYFAMLGILTEVGRLLGPDDDVAGSGRAVAVVSDNWWRTRLGASPTAVGATVYLNGTPFTVVGVAPASFRGSYDALGTDLWVPLMTYNMVRPRQLDIRRRTWGWLNATARLAPGVTIEQAQANVDQVVAGLTADFPRENASLKINIVRASALPEDLGPNVRQVLLIALVVAALALAAACANVANAQLATVVDRRREIAVRLAMGASRARIARQWLTECLLIAGVAATAGTVGALWVRDGIEAIGPPNTYSNFSSAHGFDLRLALFSAGLVGAVTILFGGWPATRAALVDVAGPLREEATSSTGPARRQWIRAMLVAAQVAVSVALLSSSVLLTRSLIASRAFDVGFNTTNLVIATPNLANLGLDGVRGRLYYRDTLVRVQALAGVKDVTLAAVAPLGGSDESVGVKVDGYEPRDASSALVVANNFVAPNYFESMRIAMRRGRAFRSSDGEEGAPIVAVVNETMARRYWADGNPIGRLIRINPYGPIEVVGVAADITYESPGESAQPFLYLPFGPVYFPYGLSFHVRTTGDNPTLLRALRRELRSFDPRIQATAMTYEELRQQALYPGRTLALLSSAFGVIALLLAIAGIYGVMAHLVASRDREFAVRLALGAHPQSLIRRVVGEGLRWGLAGVVLGTALAIVMGQLLRAFLFNVSTTDPLSLTAAALLLMAVSVVSTYAPARRVLRLDPGQMLRR